MSNHPLSQLSSIAVLDMLGLQSKPTTTNRVLTWAGLVVAGAVVGAGVALMLTPKSGRALRQDIRGSARELSDQVGQGASAVVDAARRHAHDLRHPNSDNAPKA